MTLRGRSDRDRRWLYLHRLNEIRQLCFGDEPTTTSGIVKGEDNRLTLAGLLNQLQADLFIPSGLDPTPDDTLFNVTGRTFPTPTHESGTVPFPTPDRSGDQHGPASSSHDGGGR